MVIGANGLIWSAFDGINETLVEQLYISMDKKRFTGVTDGAEPAT